MAGALLRVIRVVLILLCRVGWFFIGNHSRKACVELTWYHRKKFITRGSAREISHFLYIWTKHWWSSSHAILQFSTNTQTVHSISYQFVTWAGFTQVSSRNKCCFWRTWAPLYLKEYTSYERLAGYVTLADECRLLECPAPTFYLTVYLSAWVFLE